MKYDPLTRLLHLFVALGVTTQMLSSLVMIYPKPGRLSNQWYEVHEAAGISLLAVVSLHWLWALARTIWRGETLMLFPWLSTTKLRALWEDVVETLDGLRHARLPDGRETKPLPTAVQGAGLLLALFMAGTGTILALGMAPDGGLSLLLRAVKDVHEAAAPLIWVYLIAHPLLGLAHQLAGHRTLSRMFGWR